LTLVEILISVAILAVGAVLIMQALARGAYALSAAHVRSQVYAFSAAKMADLELSLQQGVAPNTEGQFGVGREQIRWRVKTTLVDDEPELQLVTLIVSWRQGRHDYESSVATVQRVPVETKL
jgi:hypothetical protein